MNKVQQLIRELCPIGVQKVKVKDIKKTSFWLMPSTPNFISEGVPYITSKNVKCGMIDFSDVKYISKDDYINMSSNRKIEKYDLLITMIGTIGEVAFVDEEKDFYGQNMYLIRLDENIVDRKYFYYYITSPKVRDSLVLNRNESSQGYIKAGSLENLLIPLPPIEVQQEIVRILEAFTENIENLIVELTTELIARRKQYQYYKEKLFKANSNTPLVKLENIADILRGGNFKKTEFTEVGIPCIHYGQIYTNYGLYACKTITSITEEAAKKAKYATKNDIIMAVTSENIQDICKAVAWLGEENIAIGGHTAIIKHKQNAKYLSYYFSTSMFSKQKVKLAQGTKVLDVAPNKLLNVEIPIPSLEEQEKIVNILDTFDKVCTDISREISTEIEMRKKQYEYYREKLLTFKELE